MCDQEKIKDAIHSYMYERSTFENNSTREEFKEVFDRFPARLVQETIRTVCGLDDEEFMNIVMILVDEEKKHVKK